jgi:hypothetical protein
LENHQQMQAARLSQNKRAGKIQRLDKMVDELNQPIFDHTDSHALLATIEKRHENYGDYSKSTTGGVTTLKKDRFKHGGIFGGTSHGRDQNNNANKSIDAGHMVPYKTRLSYGSPKALGNQSMSNLSLGSPREGNEMDSSMISGNHLLPSGLRYLLVNNATSNGNSPHGLLNKESPRDFV